MRSRYITTLVMTLLPSTIAAAQDSSKIERRQIEVTLPVTRSTAFDRVLGVFAALEIPVSSVTPEGGSIVGGPVEISHFGVLKDNAFFHATIVPADSATRVFLSATFASAREAAWRGAAHAPTGVVEEAATSKSKGDKKKVWARLEEIAQRLRAGS